MNIVRIKDITDIKSEGEKYNFRNKYCYAIHLNWFVPMNPGGLDDIPEGEEPTLEQKYGLLEKDYKTVEQMSDDSLESYFQEHSITYKRIDERLERYIDVIKSPMSRLNLDFYYTENDRSDINHTTPGIKRYRAYVAKFLLQDLVKYNYMDVTEPRKIKAPCPKKVAMLNYYAFDMVEDKVLQTLQMLQPESSGNTNTCETPVTNISKPTCSCQQSSNLINLIPSVDTTTCNLVRTYRQQMKKVMIESFTDLDFWRWFIYSTPTGESGAIAKIYNYTEALIKSGLSIFDRDGAKRLDLNNPCGCTGNQELMYANYQKDLNDILHAFELMKKGTESFETNISTITVALQKFATYYEYLQWEKMVISTDENWS